VGLDWNPIGKPRPGFEGEFEELFLQISQLQRGDPAESAVQERFWEISVSPYETLAAPQVGFDLAADEWARQMFPNRSDKSLTLEQFLAGMRGYYVLDLVPENDGLPVYTNAYIASYCDRFSFRSQFSKASRICLAANCSTRRMFIITRRNWRTMAGGCEIALRSSRRRNGSARFSVSANLLICRAARSH
jgi:hypothetical protein